VKKKQALESLAERFLATFDIRGGGELVAENVDAKGDAGFLLL
jgi:hypothetical protein